MTVAGSDKKKYVNLGILWFSVFISHKMWSVCELSGMLLDWHMPDDMIKYCRVYVYSGWWGMPEPERHVAYKWLISTTVPLRISIYHLNKQSTPFTAFDLEAAGSFWLCYGETSYLVSSSATPSASSFPSSSIFSSEISSCVRCRRRHFTTTMERISRANAPPTDAPMATAMVESLGGGTEETRRLNTL